MRGPSSERPDGTICTRDTNGKAVRDSSAARAWSKRAGETRENPPPMATTSRSSRFAADATAWPIAEPARSTAAIETGSPAACASASSSPVSPVKPCVLAHATVRGPEHGPVGWVADLAELDGALKAIAGELDHGVLNEKPGLESPTLEHICLHFAERLKGQFPGLSKVVVSRPTVGESCSLNLTP